MQGLRSISALFWAPEKAGVRQPILIFSAKLPFRPRKRKERHVVEVEEGSLLGFAAFKDLQVSVEEGAEEQVPSEISELWVVSKRATGDADIVDVYGVGLEDEDKTSDDEDLDKAGEVASSSSSNLPNRPALSST